MPGPLLRPLHHFLPAAASISSLFLLLFLLLLLLFLFVLLLVLCRLCLALLSFVQKFAFVFLCHIKIKEWKCAGNAGSAWKTSWRTSKNELQWIIALFALCTRSNAILSNIQLINKDNNNATSRVRLVCCLSLCECVFVCVSPSTFLCHVHKLQTKLMTASARTAQEASYSPLPLPLRTSWQ